jgi:hypothetical protein
MFRALERLLGEGANMNTIIVLIFVGLSIGVEGLVLANMFQASEQVANEYSRAPWVD